jgi:diguanylate cyclase (GGDEF)-like protein
VIEAAPSRPVVLIVDDAVENIAALGAALRGDYDVRFATGGAEALRLIEAGPIDLVLLDVMMPGLDGYEVCQRLKASEATQELPVIFLTARDDIEGETRGFEVGAVDYITKPFNVAVVRARVRTHVELKRKSDLLAATALVDGLTGIANRRRFDQELEREWRRSMRSGQPVALIMIDLDHFKAYNDAYGHLAGDECLAAVASALAGALGRAGECVARFGGEEFAAILPGCDADGALAAASQLRAAVAALGIEHRASSTAAHVTLSLGVAAGIATRGEAAAALLDAADRALYQAKQEGRDRVSPDRRERRE